jgi:hypothetical protein
MFNRIRRGWELTKKSWGVVRSHPGLIRLPIHGGILALIFGALFGVPGALLLADDQGSSAAKIGGGVLIAIGAYLASFFIVYYNVALAAAANQALTGHPVDLKRARAVARDRIGVIAAWALVSAVVSAVLSFLRDKGAAGEIVAGIGGAIWSLVTFLVVPVIAIENIGPFAAMRRSATLFRSRWGQQVTGNLVIGGIAGLIVLAGALIVAGGVALLAAGNGAGEAFGGVLLIVGLVLAIGGSVFAGATRGVFGVALYHYVAEEQAVGPFSVEELESSARRR